MALLVDTSVWSLAFRRDSASHAPELVHLRDVIESDSELVTTGVIVLELLFAVRRDEVAARIDQALRAVPLIATTFDDYAQAARTRTQLRAAGVQLGPIDALIAQLCMTYGHTLLTTDQDFMHAAKHVPLRVWSAQP